MSREGRPFPDQEPFRATFRYHGDLPGLLVRAYRGAPLAYSFREHPSVKDAIEAMGVPHTEVDIILANDRSVGFEYQLQDRDVVEVYPPLCTGPAGPLVRLAPPETASVAFILDVHLGKLARRLRLLGFDCLYRNDYSDPEIMRLARDQGRVILTRDRGILKHRQVLSGYLVRSDRVEVQVNEVLSRYRLTGQLRPWRRCIVCNGLLQPIDKNAVAERLESKTRRYYDDFHRCVACERLYWQGSHFEKIEAWLNRLLASTHGH